MTGFHFTQGTSVKRTLHVGDAQFSYRLYGVPAAPVGARSHVARRLQRLPRFSCDLAALLAFARRLDTLPEGLEERLASRTRPYFGAEGADWDAMVADGSIRDPEAATTRLLADRLAA